MAGQQLSSAEKQALYEQEMQNSRVLGLCKSAARYNEDFAKFKEWLQCQPWFDSSRETTYYNGQTLLCYLQFMRGKDYRASSLSTWASAIKSIIITTYNNTGDYEAVRSNITNCEKEDPPIEVQGLFVNHPIH